MSTVTGITTVNISPTSKPNTVVTPERNAVLSENVIKLNEALNRDDADAPVDVNTRQSAQKTIDDIRQEAAETTQEKSNGGLLAQDELQEVVKNLNVFVQNVQRDISFDFDESTGGVVVKVKNAGTEEVIRQIPSEEVLALRERLKTDAGDVTGLVLSARV